MRKLTSTSILMLLPILVSCHGDWGTCRTDCQAGYHRTEFCDCEKNLPPGSGFIPAPPKGAAARDFVYDGTPNCKSNILVFLYNQTSIGVMARYSYRDSDGNRQYNSIFVPSGFRSFDDAKKNGTVLGHDYADDAQCTLIGYELESPTSNATSLQSVRMEALNNLKTLSMNRANSKQSNSNKELPAFDSKFTTFIDKEAVLLNCRAECNPNPSINCLKGTPPDQEKLRALRLTLLSKTDNSIIPMSTITKIFGLPPKDCEREDIKFTPTGVMNNGSSCSFPIYFSSHEATPSVVIRYPETMAANQIKKDDISTLEFIAPAEMPTIKFRNEGINDQWGGHVLKISADDNGIYYQTSGGCIQMEVEKQ